jgi:hypothetical protein
MKKRRWWVVEIKGEYWHKYKTRPMGYWTKDITRGTVMSTRLARSYLKDWAAYGAVKVAVAGQGDDAQVALACLPALDLADGVADVVGGPRPASNACACVPIGAAGRG